MVKGLSQNMYELGNNHRNLLVLAYQEYFLVRLLVQSSEKESYGPLGEMCPIIVKSVIMLIHWESSAVGWAPVGTVSEEL